MDLEKLASDVTRGVVLPLVTATGIGLYAHGVVDFIHGTPAMVAETYTPEMREEAYDDAKRMTLGLALLVPGLLGLAYLPKKD